MLNPLLSLLVLAAPPPDDTIVVLGKGLALPPGQVAYGATVIDRDRLTGDASGRVEDVLADVAGLQQFRRSDSRSANASAQGVTLRAIGGNASSRALVLLDGVPLADPLFGYIPFTALSPERLNAVRVTRGASTGAFGAGAVAGTLELISAGRSELPPVSGEISYGSFGSVQAAGSVAPNLGAGYANLYGRFERGEGFYTTPIDQRVAASARAHYRDWSTGGRAVAPLDAQTEVQASATLFHDDRTLRFQGADSSSEGEDASVRLIHRGAWQVETLAYLQVRNFTNKVISSTTFRLSLDQYDTPALGLGGKIELRPPIGSAHVLRIGGDVRRSEGTLYEAAYNSATGALTTRRKAGGDETDAGLYAEDDWTIGRLILTGGARVDRWSIDSGYLTERTPTGALTTDNVFPNRDGSEATGRLGALVHVLPALDLRAAGYTGYRLPTLNELYRPFVVFPVTTQANAALAPEQLRGVEVGLDLRPFTGAHFAVTAFYNRLNNAIANVTIATNLRQRQNVDAIVAQGIEASIDLHHGPWSFTASYAFSDSHVRASGVQAQLNGLIPAQSPRHSASATLAYAPKRGLFASATIRTIGLQYEDDLQTAPLKPATTVDLVAGLPLRHDLALIARAENVGNAEVVTRNSGGTIDLGTPRTLWIGLKLGR